MRLQQLLGFVLTAIFTVIGIGASYIFLFLNIPFLSTVLLPPLGGILISSRFSTIRTVIPVLVGKIEVKSPEDAHPYIRLFKNLSSYTLAASVVGMLIGIIMQKSMSFIFGSNIAIVLITPLYGVLLSELLYQPLKGMLISGIERNAILIAPKGKKRSIGIWIFVGTVLFVFLTFFILSKGMKDSDSETVSDWERAGIESITISDLTIFKEDSIIYTAPEIFVDSSELTNDIIRLNQEHDLQITLFMPEHINSNEVSVCYQFYSFYFDLFQGSAYPSPYNAKKNILFESDDGKISFNTLIKSKR